MKRILYSKYNSTRKAQFQIGTKIFVEDGKKYVEKFALGQAAVAHINNIKKWNQLLGKAYRNIKFQEVIQNVDGAITFAYIVGERLSDKLIDTMESKEEFLAMMHSYMDKMFDFTESYVKPFEKTSEFENVFGEIEALEGMEATSACNVDMIFDNVFLCEDGMYLIDNEWGFDFPIPVDYIKYRTLFYFHRSNAEEIEKLMTREEFFQEFGIKEEKIVTFEKMEVALQTYIHGQRYIDQYVQNSVRFEELVFAKERVPQLQEEVEERNNHMEFLDSQIAVMAKEDYAKSVHIAYLDGDRNLQRSEKERLENEVRMIGYLRKHPMKRVARVASRVGNKVVEKAKPAIRKFVPLRKTVVVPQFENPKVSIVIPVYNEFQYTYDCIRTLVLNIKNVSYEVIVGDDESTDDTKKIHSFIKNVKVNVNHTDHGFLMNCNRAAELAKGEYIVFLNNDTLVQENWLESLVELIESDNSIGMVGSKLIYQNGTLQEAGGIVWSDGSGWNYGRNQDPSMPEYNYVKDVDYISGASIMVRKDLWDQLGGFDQRFIPAYYEDTDLAFAIRKLGYRVCYQPKSVVVHFEGISNGTDVNGSGLKAYQEVNKQKFLEKWAEELKLQSSGPEELFKARERGQNKKTVLFIDHYVPHFDQDAGSKSTMSYIKVFQHMGYSVKFLGDNFYQHEPYTTALEKMGIEVLYGAWYSQNWQSWIAEHGDEIDVVFANRPHITIKYIDLLKEKTSARIIYYGHDLHHIREMREYEITKDPYLLSSATYWKHIEYSIMEKSDVIFYPSYVEINEIVSKRPEFKNKAKAIPVYMFEKPHDAELLPAKEKKDLMFVGGFAHKPNADAVCWFVEEVFPLITKTYPDMKLHVIGSKPTEEVLRLASDNIIVHGFVSDEELENFYHNTRISVVPLRYGAGMKGKVVEALYYQIPLITTSIGAEGMPEAESVMEICDEAELMAEKIVDLYEKYDILDKMSKKTVDYIEQYFSETAAENIVKSCLPEME